MDLELRVETHPEQKAATLRLVESDGVQQGNWSNKAASSRNLGESMIICRTASVLAVICAISASAAEVSVTPAGGEHLVESRFQFAPGELHTSGTTARTGFDDANLLLMASPSVPFADIRVERGQENPRRGWYSDSYNKIESAPALTLSLRTALPWRAATLLFPYPGSEPPRASFTFDGRRATVASSEVGEVQVACFAP